MTDSPDSSDYSPRLLQLQREFSETLRKETKAPPADPFDPDAFPYGKEVGANKINLTVCATCGKPPTPTDRNDLPLAFLFRDELSAREYYISGMCQACQDSVFKPQPDEEDNQG